MPGQIDSSASPLTKLLIGKDKSPELIILSGPSGVGKSTWCLQLAEQARSSSLVVGGFISPPVFLDGYKVGIDLVDQFTGEHRRLAVRLKEAKDGLRTDNWLIDPNVLAWGNRQLLALPLCDIVILDELGPLELVRGRGLQAGLKLIDSRQAPLVVAVVRPKFIQMVQKRWPWGEVLVMAGERAADSGM